MIDFNSKYTGEEVETILDSVDDKYTKPTNGIPASDLAPDVFLQGEKGEKGDDGVGIASVEQTTTSSTDGGSNVVTVTLSNGSTSTFTVKNGSKGSQGEKGEQGEQGIQGPKGDTGADGAKGDKGDKGDTGAAGTNGTNGVSVSSVKQTTTSSADGGSNVVTVTLSNGTTSTFTVKNGSKGSSGSNGTNGTNGATFTPSVDSAGNLSWSNDKGLPNPATVNIKGPKGDSGGGSSGGGGSYAGNYPVVDEGFLGYGTPIITLQPNTYTKASISTMNTECLVVDFETPTDESIVNEYVLQLEIVDDFEYGLQLEVGNDVTWENNYTPITSGDCFILMSFVNNLGIYTIFPL